MKVQPRVGIERFHFVFLHADAKWWIAEVIRALQVPLRETTEVADVLPVFLGAPSILIEEVVIAGHHGGDDKANASFCKLIGICYGEQAHATGGIDGDFFVAVLTGNNVDDFVTFASADVRRADANDLNVG